MGNTYLYIYMYIILLFTTIEYTLQSDISISFIYQSIRKQIIKIAISIQSQFVSDSVYKNKFRDIIGCAVFSKVSYYGIYK